MPKRKNNLGVRPRGNRYQARPYIDGKHHWAGTWDTEKEAEEAAERKIAEVATRPPHEETIYSFSKRWVEDFPRPKQSTNDTYDEAAKRFRERIDPDDKRKLHDFTVEEALSYARKHPYDAKSLKTMYGDARRAGRCKEVPFASLGISLSRGRKDIIAITPDELELLAEIALDVHGPEFGPRFAAIIEWAADTTMRPGEIFGLDRPDVKLKSGMVNIERQFSKGRIVLPKNGQRRVLPFIPPRAEAAFRLLQRHVPPAICPITDGEILFPGKNGQRIKQEALYRYWLPVRAAFEASLDAARRNELRAARNPDKPDMDFYELRHFGATQMAERDVEDWVGAVMMGQTDGGKLFRELYSHPSHKVAAQRLRAAFGKNVKQLRPAEGKEAVGE